MNPKPLLSFCIPTWNRAPIVDEALTDLIPKIKSYGFEIIISDNASTDNTREIVEKHKQEYENIFYHVNPQNVGPDHNFEIVLKLAAERSQYAWLLGDSYRIVEKRFEDIVAILEQQKYAAVLLNGFNRIRGIPSREYDSIPSLIDEIGWHITMICMLIYSDRLINGVSYKRFYNTNFLQNGILYEYGMLNTEESYYFYEYNSATVTQISKLGNHWVKDSFQTFAKNWTCFNLSLHPGIPLAVKLDNIKRHNIKSKGFTVKNLFWLKKYGWLDYKRDVLPYKMYIPYATPTSWGTIAFISLAPYWLARTFQLPLKLYEKARNLFSGDYKRLKGKRIKAEEEVAWNF